MNRIIEAYNIKTDKIPDLYKMLNNEIEYAEGLKTSLGIIFWGKYESFNEIKNTIPKLLRVNINDIATLYEKIKTKGKMKIFIEESSISDNILKVLKHDIELWMPKAIDISLLPILKERTKEIYLLNEKGIKSQLDLLSDCEDKNERIKLSKEIKLDIDLLNEIIKICDYFRMGNKVNAIRPILYYKMGYDTFERWAKSDYKSIIKSFEQYLKENGLVGKYLVPFPKEVTNGIEWSKVHDRIFKVKY